MDVTVPAVTSRTPLTRQWELLKLLPPRSPGATASELHQRLAEAGYSTTKRTVERDLIELSRLFPLQCNDKSPPYGWHWQPGKGADLPGITLGEALTLQLLEDSLRPLMPRFMLKTLESRFSMAREKLSAMATENESARWLSKVASVQPTITQLPPGIDSAALDYIQQALLNESQLYCHYYSAHNDQQRELILNPLGLVQRGQITYLIATAEPYTDVRQFALHRFSQAELRNSRCNIPTGFQLQRYIDSGAMQFGSSEKIQLKARISEAIARLLRETPLSDDMQIIPDKTGLQLTATVSNSWELRWWILSHAPAVIVEEPQALREDIGWRLREALSPYDAAI